MLADSLWKYELTDTNRRENLYCLAARGQPVRAMHSTSYKFLPVSDADSDV